MTALGTILGVVLFVWGVSRLARGVREDLTLKEAFGRPRHPTAMERFRAQNRPPSDLDRLREHFATSDMTVEEFERTAEAMLRGEASYVAPGVVRPTFKRLPATGEWYRRDPDSGEMRTEIHVHNAPPGHHLHLHLP